MGLNPNDGYILNYEKLDGNTTKSAIAKALAKAGVNTSELLEFNPDNIIRNESQPFLSYGTYYILLKSLTIL
ncbi:MAG: hypothetical protein M0D57_08375 [Sphingobacteriales bacterium JAD_PAG50586_3]|nr:MAG: hypothetical protein M0D57_08375 [Sphingobacteriales bacterium JAD_PAG50586_3]